jgi:hypothetical protein
LKKIQYLYPVVVESVGNGCITADGKTLGLIGNLPLSPGQVVYTDGKIVYGHVPVRTQVDLPSGQDTRRNVSLLVLHVTKRETSDRVERLTFETHSHKRLHAVLFRIQD